MQLFPSVPQIASAIHAEWKNLSPQTTFSSLSTDSRAPAPGSLFLALSGESFDGNRFAAQALQNGALAAVVSQKAISSGIVPDSLPLFIVPDTKQALTDLAGFWRSSVNPFIFGITGSMGKTTAKELLSRLLEEKPTAKTLGNWNNDLGLPKSLLTMTSATQCGVFECGTNHPGEIAPLAALLRPDAAILTTVAPVHLGNFGSIDAIANEKADLLRALPSGGFAVLDADGAYFAYLKAQCPCRVVSVSAKGSAKADFFVSDAVPLTGSFMVHESASSLSYPIQTGLAGEHHILNALLAIAAARTYGISPEFIQAQIRSAENCHMRWEVSEQDGISYINDAYNANPQSMIKALETFALHPFLRHIAVLGDMLELGEENEEHFHRMVGSAAARCKIDFLIAVGSRSKWMAAQALADGISEAHILCVPDAAAASVALSSVLQPKDGVLLKASRSVALEKVLP